MAGMVPGVCQCQYGCLTMPHFRRAGSPSIPQEPLTLMNSRHMHETETSGDKVEAMVGLGYVGLPLAVASGKLIPTIGFDLSESKLVQFDRSLRRIQLRTA